MIGRRGILRGGVVLSASLLAASCARIPTSGPIEQQELGGGEVRDAPYVQPRPPEDGATPAQIVLGFVQAGVGPEDDYAVARQYLSPQAREEWDPRTGVTVYPAGMELEVTETAEGSARLTVRALSQVDERGIQTVLGAPSSREIDIVLEIFDGQWRIVNAPDGIFLSQAAFGTLFSPALLYFLDPRYLHLVPDHRWFPLQEGPRALLLQLGIGPSPTLEAAVDNAVADLSGLSDVQVTTGDDATTQIMLPASIDTLAPERRSRALAQIEASLRSLPALASVRLTLGGTVIEPLPSGELERPLPGHRPFGAGRTGVISLADITAGDGPAQLVPELRDEVLAAPSISSTTPLAAALALDGGRLMIASTDGTVPRRDAAIGGTLVPPHADDAGFVWTSSAANAGALLALSGAGATGDVQVEATWLAGRQVQALDISSDATRMILLSTEAGVARVDLCGVVRDGQGVPSAVTGPITLHTGLEEVTQISWYDETALLVLGIDPESRELRVLVLDLRHGMEVMPTPPPDTVRIAGTAVSTVIWATTSQGTLLRTNGSDWTPVDLLARDPAYY